MSYIGSEGAWSVSRQAQCQNAKTNKKKKVGGGGGGGGMKLKEARPDSLFVPEELI